MQEYTTSSEDEYKSANDGDVTNHLRQSTLVRKTASVASDKAAHLQKERYKLSHPPSIYNVGDRVRVRLHRSISRSNWKKMPVTPVTSTGKVMKADYDTQKYLVELKDRTHTDTDKIVYKWFSVADVTSLTLEEENLRQEIAVSEQIIMNLKKSKTVATDLLKIV